MRVVFALLSLMTAPAALADVVGPGGKTIECFCTDTQGLRVDLGETICLFVDGRAFMAQCQMSLNVPMWREVGQGCLSSSLPQSQPIVQPPGLDIPGGSAQAACVRAAWQACRQAVLRSPVRNLGGARRFGSLKGIAGDRGGVQRRVQHHSEINS